VTAPVNVAFNADQTRAAFTLFHQKGNIVTAEMIEGLRAALEAVAENPHLKLITLEGAGPDFSFGASIPEHAPERIADVLPRMHMLIGDLLTAPAVTAAVVRGRCLGGGFELALACDLIFAAEDASFGLPEVALGVFPPVASVLLPIRVGASRASAAILSGVPSSASAWREAGLITSTAPATSLAGHVDAWFSAHLAPRSAAALRHAAAAARAGLNAQVDEILPQLERLYLDDLMRTADAAEGIAAFMARRPPNWSDQ
jgi:cyclohexa-1,5-dienecarbonyl-CoA hydratase